jgi:hypothetical protein
MRKRIFATSLAVLAVTGAMAVLFAGAASATLIGPGGGEALNCTFTGSTARTLGSASLVERSCYGNIVGVSVSVAGQSCVADYYGLAVYANGGPTWFPEQDYCANGVMNYTTYAPNGDATQGVELHIYDGPSRFPRIDTGWWSGVIGTSSSNTPAYWTIKVWQQ